MAEAGTYTQSITISNANSNRITITVPANSVGKSFHLIGEVTDDGTPTLTGYRRIIFEPTDQTASIANAHVENHLHFAGNDSKKTYYDLTGRRLTTFRNDEARGGVVLCRDNQNSVRILLRIP
jgi:hypothetical protein